MWTKPLAAIEVEHMSAGTHPSNDHTSDRLPFPPRFSRYDLLLAVVPVAFVLGLLATGVADVPIRVSLSGAAGVGALALVDALFINPPRRPRAGNV